MALAQRLSPSDGQIREALASVLAAGEFRSSARLSRFVTYLVEEALAGRKEKLKGYTIGIDVFDKPDDFDPTHDASVRVEAIRLRRALETYYLTEGSSDPVIIDVPKGAYAPAFRFNELAGAADGDGKPSARVRSQWSRVKVKAAVAAAFAVLAVVSVATAVFLGRHIALSNTLERASELPSGPKIAVLPFSVLGLQADAEISRTGLTLDLTSDLGRFKDFFVLAANTTLSLEEITASVKNIGDVLRVDYVVSGTISQEDENLQVTAQVASTRTELIIWSQVYDQTIGSGDLMAVLDDISNRIASVVGAPHGVINRQEAIASRLRPKRYESYSCILKFYDYSAYKTPRTHLEARDCLERTIRTEPTYARAWAALSSIYGDEARFGFNPRLTDPIERSVEMARTGVRQDPLDSFTHQYLALAYFAQGNSGLFRRHAKAALDRNSNDADLLADLGWSFSLLADWSHGIPLVRKAIQLNPAHPPWYNGILALYYYLIEEYERARDYNEAYFQNDVLLAHVLKVAIASRLGRDDRAKQYLSDLVARFPDFSADAHAELRKWRIPEDLIKQLLAGLRMAGLAPVS